MGDTIAIIVAETSEHIMMANPLGTDENRGMK